MKHQESDQQPRSCWNQASLQRVGWVADVFERPAALLWFTEQFISASSDANAANGDQDEEKIKYFGDCHQEIFFLIIKLAEALKKT